MPSGAGIGVGGYTPGPTYQDFVLNNAVESFLWAYDVSSRINNADRVEIMENRIEFTDAPAPTNLIADWSLVGNDELGIYYHYSRSTGSLTVPYTSISILLGERFGEEWNSTGGAGNGVVVGAGIGVHFIGPVLLASGIKINALKPVGALGSKPGSSVASYTFSKVFPQTFTNTLGKKAGTKVATRVATNVIGRALGRFVPYFGVALTGWDIGWYLGTNYGISTWSNKSEESRLLEEIRKNGLWDE